MVIVGIRERVLKFLLLLLVAVLFWWLWRNRPTDRDRPASPRAPGEEQMVVCAHCGVYLPLSEALPGEFGNSYCCEAHRAAGARRP